MEKRIMVTDIILALIEAAGKMGIMPSQIDPAIKVLKKPYGSYTSGGQKDDYIDYNSSSYLANLRRHGRVSRRIIIVEKTKEVYYSISSSGIKHLDWLEKTGRFSRTLALVGLQKIK